MGSNIPPMPVLMQPAPNYAAPQAFPAQQPVPSQQPDVMGLHAANQQVPQFSLQPVAPQHHHHQQPQFSLPPADSVHSVRISKLAEYTARNGPAFEEQVRSKQSHNPEYSFLQGGEGSNFYQWCLFCYTKGIPIDQPQQETLPMVGAPSGPAPGMFPAHQPGGPPPAAVDTPQPHITSPVPQPVPQPGGPIPPEIASGFAQVLHVLQGSQVRAFPHFIPLVFYSKSVHKQHAKET